MSIDVPLDELAAVVADRDVLAYLVTVGDDGPRIVSVSVSCELPAAAPEGDHDSSGDQAPGIGAAGPCTLSVAVGRHTIANVGPRSAVAVFWPADAGDPDHTLIVDGMARPAAGASLLVITPSAAVRHRVRAGRGR